MHSDRRASHPPAGLMSDDDEEERDGDHNSQPAGTRDYAEELAQLAGGGVTRLPKSRYESISVYLANCAGCAKSYNDLNAPIDQTSMDMLLDAGVDADLAQVGAPFKPSP